MRGLTFAAVIAVAVLSALNWRAQLQTQQKLDAFAAKFAGQPAVVAPSPAPAPEPAPKVTVPAPGAVPRELTNLKLAPYVIEAPDVLTIEVAAKDPKTGKPECLPDQPISGQFPVRLDGAVSLGPWGSVVVSGLTTEQATAAIRKHLTKFDEKVSAESLVVTVAVLSHNSKRYYVVTDSDGFDDEAVFPFPVTGSETILDAIANVSGLPDVAGKRNIWVARRTANPGAPWQTLPVDWTAITQNGVTTTNYQLLPGDRVYVKRAAN